MKLNMLRIAVCAALLISAVSMPETAFARERSEKVSSINKGFRARFFRTVDKLKENRSELRLSDSQVKKITSLAAEVGKNLEKRDAEVQTLGVEINTLMWESPFDTDKVNSLVAQHHEVHLKWAQYLVVSLNKLYEILTPKQLKKLSAL